jgi:hypothetical protein
MPPFGQNGGVVLFERFAGVQVALLVEKDVDRGMDGDKFLEVLVSRNLTISVSRRRNG